MVVLVPKTGPHPCAQFIFHYNWLTFLSMHLKNGFSTFYFLCRHHKWLSMAFTSDANARVLLARLGSLLPLNGIGVVEWRSGRKGISSKINLLVMCIRNYWRQFTTSISLRAPPPRPALPLCPGHFIPLEIFHFPIQFICKCYQIKITDPDTGTIVFSVNSKQLNNLPCSRQHLLSSIFDSVPSEIGVSEYSMWYLFMSSRGVAHMSLAHSLLLFGTAAAPRMRKLWNWMGIHRY